MAASISTATTLDEAYLQEYNGHKLIAASVALMVLEIVCVGLRFASRHISKTAMGLDDWLIGPSFLFCFGLTVISICTYGNIFIQRMYLRTSRSDRSMIPA